MGGRPRNAPLPPHRKWWVERMSPSERRSYLIAEELERLAVSREGDESSAVRRFLVAWRKASGNGNLADLELRVKQVKAKMAVVFAFSPYVGPVRWLPVITPARKLIIRARSSGHTASFVTGTWMD